MGKIRVKTLGDEETEKDSREARSRSARQKEVKLEAEAKKVGKGGQKVNVVGPSEEELKKVEEIKATEETKETKVEEPKKKKSQKKTKAKARSKRYQEVKMRVDRTKRYPLKEALELLPKVSLTKFDETVELHINTVESLSGNLTLPHGTGKKVRTAIATDDLIAEIEKGKINFDILLAEPSQMAKLAKVAKILGPRGLMPNPKNGTISADPRKTALLFEGGMMSYKTEAKAPILHLTVGKLSFGDQKLHENIKTIVESVKKEKIKSAVLKSTMSPGIKVDVSS